MRAIIAPLGRHKSRLVISKLMLISTILSSCGGGGAGGVASEEIITSSADLTISASEIATRSTKYNTAEYAANWGLDAINAKEAYAILEANDKTVAGDGVTVTVLDLNYVEADHNELSGKVSDADAENEADHATHVAAIIAGSRDGSGMHGVAYDAEIQSLGLSHEPYLGFYNISSDSSVVNLSWKLDSEEHADTLKSLMTNALAANSSILYVAATGNDSESEAAYPARFAADAGLQGNILAVTSIDSDMEVSYFSNECGEAKDYCLAAPGGSIYSAITGDDYDYLGGTSMAAPHVSGAAAVIKGAWNYLTPAQISEILLDTAIKVDENGNIMVDQDTDYSNEVYGKGLLNLQNALMAQGDQQITSSDHVDAKDVGYSLEVSSLSVNSNLVALSNINGALADAVAFDKYGRDYKLNLDGKVNVQNVTPLYNFALASQDLRSQGVAFNNVAMSFTHDEEENAVEHFSFNYAKDVKGTKLGFAINEAKSNSVVKDFSTISNFNQNTAMSFSSSTASVNPSFSLAKQVAKNVTLNNYANFYDLGKETKNHNFGTGLAYNNKGFAAHLNYGLVQEKAGNLLNSESEGAFGLNNDNMQHLSLALSKDFGAVSIFAEAFFAKTEAEAVENGLISSVTDIYSRELKFGAVKQLKKTSFGVVYKEPLKAVKGSLNLNYAIGRDAEGNIIRNNQNLSLVSQVTEQDLEVFMKRDLKSGSVSMNAIYRRNPGHQDVDSDLGIMFKITKNF